ncbi:MAG TPA: amidohydrolase [Candidatus Enterocloster excrementipullorum]|uniref:Amidohydrolase n=1 Tax=Candidatus Enterocloster excrementipullorum TaxID=2838559 RepID=A0A9D2SHF2_9FIRM|nr:amidohydrolase [Candidatus Enterocloster excrementipullorum]
MISSKEEKFFEAVDAREEALAALSKEIWGYAELGLKEVQSSKAIAAYLEKEGFKVQLGVGSIPTAICAEYGFGHPVIAYLGEYDALPQLDQKVAAHKEWQHPERPESPGHGCGHNNLGVGAVGAAIFLKEAIASGAVKGTVRFYGCPAEETLVGKVFMVRDGAFKDVDCAMTWHSHAYNGAWGACYTCMNSVKFHFHGKAAHAAGHPFDGRSALDAVELMNVAANYMREHVKPDVRLHYSTIFNGAPNVVPDKCSVWYYIRAPKRKDVDEVYAWLCDCAKGAALMTQTSFDIEFLTGCSEVLPNDVLEQVMLAAYKDVGAPKFTPEDYAFAEKIAETYPEVLARDRRVMKEEYGVNGDDKFLCDVVFDKVIENRLVAPGSTDVGDVSHVVPTYQIYVAGQGIGCPGHSWQMTAYSGSHVGIASMLCAAKVLGLSGLRLLEQPELVEAAWDNFRQNQPEAYVSPLPEDLKPDLEG